MKDRANFNMFFHNYAELGYAIDKFHGNDIIIVLRSFTNMYCKQLKFLNTISESMLIDLHLSSILQDSNFNLNFISVDTDNVS